MAYFVVTSTSKAALEKEVERYCKMGWKPQGGIAYWDITWAQAMTKATLNVTVNYPTGVPAYQELFDE